MHRKLALQGRIIALAALIVFAFLGVCAWMFTRYASAVYQEKEVATRHIVEVAAATVDRYAGLAADGRLTSAEARQQALAVIRSMRYGQGDYVWVNDMHPRMLMHPTNPKLDGQDMTSFADPTGRRVFVEFVETCRRDGAGFVHYLWAKPGHDQPQPKTSYVKRVAGWDWVVGSGIYVDDVRDQLWAAAARFGTAVFGVVVVTGVIGWRMVRATVGPIAQATSTLQSGSDQVTAASVQVASAATSLSDDATRQAASIEEISASMEEMAALTRANAEHAGRVAASTTSVGAHVDTANRMLGRMGASMAAIEQSSAKVTGIVKAIDEIAFQTNILALNAAVEAARAGEAGMGFAVVADEVRALAQRAATAAHDAAALVEESVTSAREGGACLGEFSGEMGQVTAGMTSMRDAAGAVQTGSEQQRQGIEQVSKAVGEMERITQKTAAMAEETAAASEELQAQAETSRAAVREIASVVGVSGDRAAEGTRAQTVRAAGGAAPRALRRAA